MTHEHDAVVVGGGIAGANCALQLARAGVTDVLVLEGEEPASKASGRAAGNLTTYRHERFGAAASRLGRELYEELAVANDDLVLHRERSYSVAYTDEGADSLREEAESTTLDTELLTAEELAERETAFATGEVTAALRMRNAVYTDPKRLTLAVHAAAREAGVELAIETVRDVSAGDGGGRLTVETDAGEYDTPVVIVAAGAWTGPLLQRAGTDVALQPRTSQIAILDPPEPMDVPIWSAPDFSVYGRPTPEGRVLFGGGTSTHIGDLDRFRTRALVPFLGQVAERAPYVMPALERATLHDDWAGRVSATPDRHPHVGETDVDGLYVCAGFNGEGISNSPFAARLLADLVLDRDPIVDPSTFDPMRYPGDETFEIGNAVEWWDDR
jgi:sarcosine oxidase subunit beta